MHYDSYKSISILFVTGRTRCLLKLCASADVCSYLRQNGVNLHTIAVISGHRDLRMTERYAHLNVDSLRKAVEVLGHVPVTVENNEVKASG